jgi:hypothetical protein
MRTRNIRRLGYFPALFVLIAFGFLVVCPAFSDFIDLSNVNVNSGASGSGSLTAICFPSCSGNVSAPPLEFSASNTSLGTFTASGSTSLVDPYNRALDSIMGHAKQIIAATPDSLDIDFQLVESSSTSLSYYYVPYDPLGVW